MKFLKVLILFISIAINPNSQRNLKDYYYPFSNKVETKVYKYVDKQNPTNIEYWEITSFPEANELKTISYDSKFNVYNEFCELITKTGAKLIEYSDFEKNKGKDIEIKAEILNNDVFKWNDKNEYSYFIKYQNKYEKFSFRKKEKLTELRI